jgi:hypothetical protein
VIGFATLSCLGAKSLSGPTELGIWHLGLDMPEMRFSYPGVLVLLQVAQTCITVPCDP